MFRIIQECALFIKNNHNFLISVLVSDAFPVFHKTGLVFFSPSIYLLFISRCPNEQRKYLPLRNVCYLTGQSLPTVANCTWLFEEHSLSLLCYLHLQHE